MLDDMQLGELLELEKVMNVSEEVTAAGTDYEQQHLALVSPFRKFIQTDVLDIKQAPFSSAEKIPSRLYIFDDLMIIAVTNDGSSPAKVGSMVAPDDNKRKRMSKFAGKYQVLCWLDLHRCTVKMGSDPNVVQVTFVTRQLEQAKKGGTGRILTRVEKIELHLPGDQANRLYTQITVLVEELIEQDIRRASMSSNTDTYSLASTGGDSVSTKDTEGEKTRGWASRKNTLKRNGTLRSKGHGSLSRRTGSVASMESDSVAGLSLADIESRYQINLDAPSLPNGSVEFYVEFGEGPMGFSLSSGAGVGVIVGRVAENSFSDDAGVCVGDRVIEVDGKAINVNTAWQSVVEIIKSHGRPLRIKFERMAGRVQEKEQPNQGPQTEKKRAWAKKKQMRAHATESDDRLISLKEMEKLYKSGRATESTDTFESIKGVFAQTKAKDKDEVYQLAAQVLEEIWNTERAYVLDLRTLVREFIIPLRRTVRRTKCKDTEGSRICEHGVPRSGCSRASSSAATLLSVEDMRTIFVNIETLVKINTELLKSIEQDLAKMSRSEATVGNIANVFGTSFAKVMPFFKLYGQFCHQYPIAIERLLVCRTQSADLQAKLVERERKAGVSLNSLLIKPVQRICKYPLLFKELLKHVARLKGMEKNLPSITKSLQVVEDIANHVDEIVGQNESSESLIDVFHELGGEAQVPWLITPSRKFISRTNVLWHEAPYQAEAKLHVMLVCSDMLLFCKGKDVQSGFGSLKNPLSSKKTRGSSLKKVFKSSLKKSMRNSLTRTSSSHKSGNRSGPRSLGKGSLKLVKSVELKSVTPRLLLEPDDQGCFGIEIKYVERSFDGGKNGTGKQLTKINKSQIWMHDEAEQGKVMSQLEALVERLKDQEDQHKRAQRTHGTPRAARNWKSGRVASKTNSLHRRRTGAQ
mmetsp:Transcript_5034/g.9480  ORF Transcript_5034/g.9480 Transcript_5034/m.9480 type:complete len:919 (-) Transcript_5034:1018-3774(-)